MAAKKELNSTLPLSMEDEATPSTRVTYANEVVAIIAGLAANEVEGIAGMCSISGNILSKNRNVTKGVKVEIGTEEVAVELYVIVEYGTPIQRAAMDAQENVRKAIESMTGLHVVRVDVHIQGVSFEQENKALQSGAASAALEAGEDPVPEDKPEVIIPTAEEKKEEEKKPPKPKAKTPRTRKSTAEKPAEENKTGETAEEKKAEDKPADAE